MRDAEIKSTSTWNRLAFGLLGFGFLLRLAYALRVYPYVDEYMTAVAAQAVLQKGVPVLPSGQFYNHGILYTYLTSVAIALLGSNRTTLRLPALLVTIPTMWITYITGRRWFTPRAGLLALALLALSPDAIEWGGRARLYSLWQFLAVAAAILLYDGLLGSQSSRSRCLAMLSLTGATLCHLLTLLMLPGLGAGLLVAWLLRRQRLPHTASRSTLASPDQPATGTGKRQRIPWAEIITMTVCVIALLPLVPFNRDAPRYGIAELQIESLVSPIKLAVDLIIAGWQFLKTPYWLFTIIWLTALLGTLLRLRRRQGTEQDAKLLYLSIIVMLTIIGFTLITPVFARRLNYVFDLLPLYFLVVGYGLDTLVTPFQKASKGLVRQVVHSAPLALVVLVLIPFAVSAATKQHFGGEISFKHVQKHWQEGDVVVTHLPATAQEVLGRCDYFVALSQPFIVQADDGTWVDAILGLPWISTADDLREVVSGHPRAWLVVNKRLIDDYETALGDWASLTLETWDTNVYLVQPDGSP
jgi:uncharacterized membrane protein